jgi:hypothetical protein
MLKPSLRQGTCRLMVAGPGDLQRVLVPPDIARERLWVIGSNEVEQGHDSIDHFDLGAEVVVERCRQDLKGVD